VLRCLSRALLSGALADACFQRANQLVSVLAAMPQRCRRAAILPSVRQASNKFIYVTASQSTSAVTEQAALHNPAYARR